MRRITRTWLSASADSPARSSSFASARSRELQAGVRPQLVPPGAPWARSSVLGSRPRCPPLVSQGFHRMAVHRGRVALEPRQLLRAQCAHPRGVARRRQPASAVIPCARLEEEAPGAPRPTPCATARGGERGHPGACLGRPGPRVRPAGELHGEAARGASWTLGTQGIRTPFFSSAGHDSAGSPSGSGTARAQGPSLHSWLS